jgi:sensor histidine kinase YesM
MEKVIEDLVDRITKTEDKANQEEKTAQRATRSTSSLQQTQVEATIKKLTSQTK